MTTLTDEQKKALEETPISAARFYIDKKVATDEILSSLAKFEFTSLSDLYTVDFNQLSDKEYKSFPRKRTLKLQKLFRELPDDVFDDIVFWNKKCVFPSEYSTEKSLLENVDDAFEELFDYVKGAKDRINQIENKTDKNRVNNLFYILNALYKERKDVKVVAEELKKQKDKKTKSPMIERVRQIWKLEFLFPLFAGNKVSFFHNVSIHEDIVSQRNDILYTISPKQPSLFVQHALKIEYVELINNLGYIIVPAETKGVYETLLKSFFDEMTTILRPISEETVLEIISKNKAVVKDILSKDKVYNEEFIYALLNCGDLFELNEKGVLLRYEHIRVSNGEMHQERALARIIADATEPLSSTEIGYEYIKRYGGGDVSKRVATTKKYGCKAIGKTGWVYSDNHLTNPPKWVEEYSKKKGIFYFADISSAIEDAGYTFAKSAPRTLRTYITNCCRVDTEDRNHFCYKECTDTYPDYNWTTSSRKGILNWISTEIKTLFDKEKKDTISIKDINSWLYERGRGTDYEEERASGYATLISSSALTADGGPFTIEVDEKGHWYLKKNAEVYNSIDWWNFGKRGGLFEKKLVAEAINIIKKSKNWEVPLWDLAKDIFDAECVEGLTQQQIRKKLLRGINSPDIIHALKLKPVVDGRKKWVVSIDASKNIEVEKYRPTSDDVKIEYKTISQISALDWDDLRPVLYSELRFCSGWLKENRLCSYDDAFVNFEKVIRNSSNKNLNKIVLQRLYEFFFVSDPTEEDQYCIMCTIAKNFEALLQEIYYINTGVKHKKSGIYDLAEKCEFYAFYDVLSPVTRIRDLSNTGYEYALKYLSFVRNSDAHGEWYIDSYVGDPRPEAVKNVEKIKKFAALYIFAVAKYLNKPLSQ